MGLKKCPRCELNYILDGGELCSVCREEVRGMRSADDSTLLCSVCGELPALPGQDMCKACLLEMRSIDILSTDADEDEAPVEKTELKPDPISGLDEMEEVDDIDSELEEEAEAEPDLEEAISNDDLNIDDIAEIDDALDAIDIDGEDGDDEEQ